MFGPALALTAVFALLASLGVWLVAARLPTSAARWTLRGVGVALIATVLAPFFFPRIASELDRGAYVCASCGRSMERLQWLGVPLWTEPGSDEVGVGPTSGVFATTFASEIGAEHAHEWLRVGCHLRGLNSVTCTRLTYCSWFVDLPKVTGRELARAYVTHFHDESPWDQAKLLRSYDNATNRRLDPDTRFRRWREAWRGEHSDWP
jgi:hypothetical protein